MKTIKVLDHGYVKYVAHMGSDESIIEAARMSTGRGFVDWDETQECTRCKLKMPVQTVIGYKCVDGSENHDWKKAAGDSKLLSFLYANKHMTPFEMCELAIEVQAPIMVFREWHRHRTQSYNEFSARYEQMPDLHYLPDAGRIQKQSAANKQGSGDTYDATFARSVVDRLAFQQRDIYASYDKWVNDDGVAKEVARLNTPVSRYSKMRAKTDLRNWLGFLQLRMAGNAQLEIRQYANAVAEIVKELWPRTFALFEEHDLGGVHLSKSEAALLRDYIEAHTGWHGGELRATVASIKKKLGVKE